MKTHSKPVTPPENTSIYIRVVQGRKIRPSKGQIQELKAVCHTIGLKSHQSAPTKRGPIKTNNAKMQHIVNLLFSFISRRYFGYYNRWSLSKLPISVVIIPPLPFIKRSNKP
jgi:hypothetical protein